MVQSSSLKTEVDAMRKIERAMSNLTDRTKARVTQWFVDVYHAPQDGEDAPANR